MSAVTDSVFYNRVGSGLIWLLKCGPRSSCSWPPPAIFVQYHFRLTPRHCSQICSCIASRNVFNPPPFYVRLSRATLRVPVSVLIKLEALLPILSFLLTISRVFCGYKQLHTRVCVTSHKKRPCVTATYLTLRRVRYKGIPTQLLPSDLRSGSHPNKVRIVSFVADGLSEKVNFLSKHSFPKVTNNRDW